MDKDIKVVHIFAQMDRGGAESLIMNVMRNLTDKRVKFIFLVSNPSPGHFDQEIYQLGGEIKYISPPSLNRKFSQELKSLFYSIKPDVVHSHVYTFSGFILKIANECHIPVRVSHSHTIGDNKKKSLPRFAYISLMKMLINKNATHLLGCSAKACEKLFGKAWSSDSRVKIIRNAIDINQFTSQKEVSFDIRRLLNLETNSLVIGHVGSFRYPKNHARLVKIFKKISEKHKDAHLVLVGDGPLRSEIEKLIRENEIQNRVHLIGVREDVPILMQQLDLFLFPSIYEGLGLVLIEAQAAGVHCISSDQVPKDADLGMGLLKFLPLDKSDDLWANEMLASSNSPKIDWSVRKVNIMRNGYDIKSTVKELEGIYLSNSGKKVLV